MGCLGHKVCQVLGGHCSGILFGYMSMGVAIMGQCSLVKRS